MAENAHTKLGLLDEIAKMLGCTFISDLHQSFWLGHNFELLKQLNANDYCVTEWNNAIIYLTGNEMNFSTAQQAKDYLLSQKKPHKKYY